MKRVGVVKRQALARVATAEDRLRAIRHYVQDLTAERVAVFSEVIEPELERNQIHLLHWEELTEAELDYVGRFFRESIFPVLTPLSVDPGHPFPFISSLSTSVGVLMSHPDKDEAIFARIKVPPVFPTWLRVSSELEGEYRFISLYEVIGRNVSALFPGMKIIDVMMFRVTRNVEVERDREDVEDLLLLVAEELKERRFAEVVRLEHGPKPNPTMIAILREELGIDPVDIYELPVWLEQFSLKAIADLRLPQFSFPPWIPIVPPAFADDEANVFDVIKRGDVLVHHPYESFSASVERFIRTAVEDPNVVAIKMTLYRTGDDSPFIPLLIRAAEMGKQVACLVELKARLDEERNITVARALEKAGIHVVYGIVGLKTHCKLALVVRKELDGMRCYAHLGTGNYHAKTSSLYTDLGIFTCKKVITDDVVNLFHYLTGRSLQWHFHKLLVAPIDLRSSFVRMIQREREHAKSGIGGRVILKMNNLEDKDMIQALYDASQDGVKIDLIVRSICCLTPRLPGVSENIRVFSVLGRFLEHSRIFYFRNAADKPESGEFFMGSADWMTRNLDERVEAIAPIDDPNHKARVWDLLVRCLEDERQSWEMNSDGSFGKRWISNPAKPGYQAGLMKDALDRRRNFPLG